MHEPTKHRFRPGTTLENAQTLVGWACLAVASNAALYLKAPGITGGKAVMDYEAMAEDAAALARILDRKAGEMVGVDYETLRIAYDLAGKEPFGDQP